MLRYKLAHHQLPSPPRNFPVILRPALNTRYARLTGTSVMLPQFRVSAMPLGLDLPACLAEAVEVSLSPKNKNNFAGVVGLAHGVFDPRLDRPTLRYLLPPLSEVNRSCDTCQVVAAVDASHYNSHIVAAAALSVGVLRSTAAAVAYAGV